MSAVARLKMQINTKHKVLPRVADINAHRLIITWQQNKRWEEPLRMEVKGRNDLATGWQWQVGIGPKGHLGRWEGGTRGGGSMHDVPIE